MFIKRFFAFVISALIIFTPLTAFAASNWKVDTVKSSGARVVLGASNNGYKSAINIAPNLLKIAKYGLKGANLASWAIAAAGLLNDGVDFVLDPANNRVKYKVAVVTDEMIFAAIDDKCKSVYGSAKTGGRFNKWSSASKSAFSCIYDDGETAGWFPTPVVSKDRFVSLDVVAPQIVKDVQSTNAQTRATAQALLRDVATAAVIAGDYDADLLAGAVPTTETKPLIPSIPGVQAGDVGGSMTGGDVGAAADASKAAADSAKAAAQAAKDAADSAAADARKAADDAKDLINSAVDQAIKDAAAAVAAEAAKAAAEAAKVADAAAVESAKAAAEAARKAAEAAKVESAKQAEAAAALEAARAAGDADRIAAAESALAQAKADAATAAKAAEEAKAAAEEAAAAKPEAKPFELPAFCSWATPVCDFIEWFKADPPAELAPKNVPFGTVDDVGLGGVDRYEQRIDFQGQCPSSDFSFQMMGVTFAKPIPYHYLCDFLTQIAPWLLAMCYLGTAYFVVENV